MNNKLKAIKESVKSYKNKVSIITKKLENKDFNFTCSRYEIEWSNGTKLGFGIHDCALCKYVNRPSKRCPIVEYLEYSDDYCNCCQNTPFNKIIEILRQVIPLSKEDQLKELLLANVNELEFLKKVQSFIEKDSNHEQ